MNSASTLRPAQNNSADSEIYIQDYMQSICSLYIHRIYAVPNQKMASIYPGQRLLPFFFWVRHPWKRNVQSKTRAPEQNQSHRRERGSIVLAEKEEDEEEEEEEEEVYRRRSVQ